MLGAGCVLVLAMGAAEPAGPLTLPAPERASPKSVPASKPVPRPRVTPPRRLVKPAAPSQHGLAESLGLEARADGGYDYEGRKGERFDATIRRDGVVEFELDPTVDLKVEGICMVAICSRRTAKTRRERRKKAAVTVVALLAEAAIGRFSTGTVNYGHPTAAPINWSPFELPAFHVATVQGRYGHLTTPAASMQEFMDRTYELRVEMARTAGLEDLEEAHKRLPTTLLQLWRDDARSLAERRAAILELWADLDHAGEHVDPVVAGDHRLEERRRESIAGARATIRAFVRRHAPEGSPQAFTAAELEAFNSRPDAVRFDPY